jgi:hypothetical protein
MAVLRAGCGSLEQENVCIKFEATAKTMVLEKYKQLTNRVRVLAYDERAAIGRGTCFVVQTQLL